MQLVNHKQSISSTNCSRHIYPVEATGISGVAVAMIIISISGSIFALAISLAAL
jgi:hypothetical protein